MASGSAWIMGAGRAQAAACLDGAGPRVLGRISPRSGVPVVMGLVSGGVSFLATAAYLAVAGRDNQKYFSAALVVSIALIVLAYLLIFPAFVALRLREPGLKRTFRVPGGVGIAWLVTGLATGWSLLAAVCLLWPGLGTADPDAALPAGFASQRGQFELLVLVPIGAVITATTAYYLVTRPSTRARRASLPRAAAPLTDACGHDGGRRPGVQGGKPAGDVLAGTGDSC
jgi:amino acid transporter